MKMVHAHFPITAIISKDKKQIEIKNFLGGKRSHLIQMQPGCTVQMSSAKDVKNELIFEGIDNSMVSLCCAQVSGVCKIKQKDERKFLDGIFVSAKELIAPKDD
jgi:large subunit ribosomal protein L9e